MKELFALDRWGQAHSEWRAAAAGTGQHRTQGCGQARPKQEGWHDRAIFTPPRTGYWDDLEVALSAAACRPVEENARRHGIDITWVFA